MASNTVWRWEEMTDQKRNRKAPIEQAFEWFLLARNFSVKTREVYRDALRSFLGWMKEQGHEGTLGELDPQLVRQWRRHLESNGRSINTIRGYLATMKSFGKYLAEDRIILDRRGQPVDLFATIKVPPLPRARPQVYQDQELEDVLGAISANHQYGARNIALVRLLLDGGLRLREACQLRVQDIDWASGRIHIRWESAKRRKERVTHVGNGTLSALKRYIERYRPHTTMEEVFIDQDGGPLTTNAVQCVLRRLRLKHGFAHLSAHQFRRTWATNFRRMGIGDLYDLQREGGWEDLSVPQRFYVDVDDRGERRASVLDSWETTARKRERARPVQGVAPVQVVQVGELEIGRRSKTTEQGGNGRRKRV